MIRTTGVEYEGRTNLGLTNYVLLQSGLDLLCFHGRILII